MSNASIKFFIALIPVFWFVNPLAAQLDSVHYIPPMYAGIDQAGGEQWIYLSTPETAPFSVSVTTGSGTPIGAGRFMLSNTAPQRILISSDVNGGKSTVTVVDSFDLSKALSNRGVILRASKPFYANFRTRTFNHAASLTAKGLVGLGQVFRAGMFHSSAVTVSNHERSHFISLMATQNNTVVQISDYAPGIVLSGQMQERPTGPISVTLSAGQSYAIGVNYSRERPVPANINGLMGALITSDKPIAVNCGSWVSSPNLSTGNTDIGIDQIVPFSAVGDEYILCRGEGPDILETPIVVAHLDGTDVFVNGSTTPIARLNAGDYAVIPESEYTDNGNLYVRATQPVFMYQSLGAELTRTQTGSLNFIPPLHCQSENFIDKIPDVQRIGNLSYQGSAFVIAGRNATIKVEDDSTGGRISGPFPVPGTNLYATYKINGLKGNVRITSNGPLQAGILGQNNNAGWGGFFSGFKKVVVPEVSIRPNKACADTLYLRRKNAPLVQWTLNGKPLKPPNDTVLTNLQAGEYVAIGGFRTFCGEVVNDTARYAFVANPNLETVSLGPDTTIKIGETLRLRATFSARLFDSIVWKPAVPDPRLGFNQEVTPLQTTEYEITVYYGSGCRTSDLQLVTVKPDFDLYVPNVFSPNDDGDNDIFEVFPGRGVLRVRLIQIFHRWGGKVFERAGDVRDGSGSWDGTVGGRYVDNAVFVYLVEVELLDGSVKRLWGDVTVAR